MRIQYLSDLHLESWAFTLKVRSDADVLVLAGDIASAKHSVRFEKLLTETMGKPTIVLHGNHEFYNGRMDDVKKERLSICKRYPNVHLLDDSSVRIKDVLFVGCTLWSNFCLPFTFHGRYQSNPPLAYEFAIQGVADFYRIAHNGIMLRPDMVAEMHAVSRQAIWNCKKSKMPTVVCTHFLPSPLSIDPQFKDSFLNPYFASNCEDLMGDNVKAWIHGHTHHSCKYHVNGTLVACNPRGYKEGENKNFDSQAVIDVEV